MKSLAELIGKMDALFAQSEINPKRQDVLGAVLPLLKLLSLTIIGLVLAHPKAQIIPRATFKLLSKLVFAIFLPCTIFVHLGESITLENFIKWWFIPVNVIISTAIGCVLGYLVAKICKPPPEFIRFTIIVTAFGNTGNLPLAIVGSVCHSPDNPFGPHCHRNGTAYVSFAQWVAVLLVYTLVYHMMEPPLEYYEIVEDEETGEEGEISEIEDIVPINNDNNISRPLLVEAEWPGMEENETEHCKTPFIARIFHGISQTSIPDPDYLDEPGSPKSIQCLAEPRVVRRIRTVVERTPVKHILSPPTIATLLAFFVGMVPPLKAFVFKDDAPLSFILDSFDILAGAMVPSVMLVLGGMLAEGPNESKLGIKTTVGVIFARLVLLPVAGIGVVSFAEWMGILIPGDQMFRFVLLLQYTMPSAILFGAIASLRGYAVSEASALLFWQHVLALFSISFYTIIYFKLLPTYV